MNLFYVALSLVGAGFLMWAVYASKKIDFRVKMNVGVFIVIMFSIIIAVSLYV